MHVGRPSIGSAFLAARVAASCSSIRRPGLPAITTTSGSMGVAPMGA
jgi:hypothetical protein